MAETSGTSQRARPAVVWLLAAVLAVSFALRLWLSLKLPFFFDDHYVINNILQFLKGSLRPRHAFYGSLSYVPQALVLAVCDFLHSRTGIAALAVHGTDFQGLTLVAYRITRMFLLAYGLLSLGMVYLLGRRLVSPWVGVIAAAVLAAYPRHLRSSVELKPDMLALLFTVITLYWTVGATRSPRLSRFLLAGFGVGLATAAKYTGVASALPLTVWALWTGWHDRRRWGWLGLAGVTSLATFFALNPFIGTVLYYAPRLVRGYAAHARQDRSDHWTVLRGEIEFIASSHGWLLGAFLLLGLGLLIVQLWRKLENPENPENTERTASILLLSLFLGYPVVHAMVMTLFRRQNLMPAMPAAALVCAYGMVRCGEWLRRSRAFTRAPGLMVLAALVPAFVLVAQPFGYAYTEIVPTTWDGAQEVLRERLAPLRGRHIAYESLVVKQLGPLEDWRRTPTTGVPSLATLPPAWLDLTDAEVFPLAQLQGPQAAFYEARRRRSDAVEIPTKPFTTRGTPLLVLLHAWTQAGDAFPLGLQPAGNPPEDLAARLPDAGDVVSIEIFWPVEIPPAALQLQPDGRNLPLLYGGNRRRQIRFLTPRFRYTPGAEIRIPGSAQADPTRFRLQLWRWEKGQQGQQGQ